MTNRILVVETDDRLREERTRALAEQGYEVYSAADHKDAVSKLAHEPDLVLLCDCQHQCVPWACVRLLKKACGAPCVAITGDHERMVEAFRAGVDECTDDPLKVPMLVAGALPVPRARPTKGNGHSKGNGHLGGNGHPNGHHDGNGHSSKSGNSDESLLDASVPLFLDEDTYQVHVNGSTISTTATEFKVLAFLIKNTPNVVTHEELLTEVWGPEYIDDGGILRLYIHTLRGKIAKAGGERGWIKNMPRVGYSFEYPDISPALAD